MKVLHFSTYDRVGGAAIAAYRQHEALLRMGVESRMLVKIKVTDDAKVQVLKPSLELRHRLPRVLRRCFLKMVSPKSCTGQPFSDDRSDNGGRELEGLPPHDIVNVHWTAGFIDQPALFRKLPSNTPVVITMHDMNAFTGGCHYDMSCGRFTDQCGNCPQLKSGSKRDFSRATWSRKSRSYGLWSASKIHFIADSHWLAQQARSSSLLSSFPVSVIHYGIDTNIFRPLGRTLARQALGIPIERNVLMFAADSLEDERKGGQYLYDALATIKAPLFLVTAGRGHPPVECRMANLHLGNVDCENVMALAYSAADVFVIPSVQEAFGQTALEAAACGIPVIGFNVGGIPDIVINGETGILCEMKDVVALGEAIERLLMNEKLRKEMGARARDHVEQNFTFQMQAGKYISLYEELLKLA
jgi:glycosyltransferase involved in cell wall biosynthesis